jgi:hypothetical protein
MILGQDKQEVDQFLLYIHHVIRMRCEGHVARMGDTRNGYKIFVGKARERDQWEDQDVNGWTILKWILDKMGWYGLDRTGSG